VVIEVVWTGINWTDLAQNRSRLRSVMNAVMKLRVLQNGGNLLTSWEPVSFSRRALLHGISKSVRKPIAFHKDKHCVICTVRIWSSNIIQKLHASNVYQQ
jgi:hypothetical protein